MCICVYMYVYVWGNITKFLLQLQFDMKLNCYFYWWQRYSYFSSTGVCYLLWYLKEMLIWFRSETKGITFSHLRSQVPWIPQMEALGAHGPKAKTLHRWRSLPDLTSPRHSLMPGWVLGADIPRGLNACGNRGKDLLVTNDNSGSNILQKRTVAQRAYVHTPCKGLYLLPSVYPKPQNQPGWPETAQNGAGFWGHHSQHPHTGSWRGRSERGLGTCLSSCPGKPLQETLNLEFVLGTDSPLLLFALHFLGPKMLV